MLRFGEFVLDREGHRLTRAGVALDVQPKVIDLLCVLVDEPGRLWTRGELQERLWPGVFVTDASLSQIVRRLRDTLGEDPRAPRLLETVPRRGYRFLGEVRAAPAPLPSRSRPPAFEDVFVGRAADVDAVRRQLDAARLVTLVGPGGIGKTRLASAVTADADVAFCDLAPCATAGDVLGAVAAGVGLVGADATRVIAALGHQLVVLDNGEQVADALASCLAGWLREAPTARFLVTSRVRLGLAAEVCVEVQPLDPAEAVALYEVRARAACPDAEDPEADVAALVARLDGLPLAVELAAARRRLLTPREVWARLERGEDVLGRARADRPDRQASMSAAATWSWGLLTPREQEACARCAVFRGGFPFEGAEAAGLSLDELEALRDHSWLTRRGPRLGQYEVLRAFAEAQLDGMGLRAEAEAAHVRACARLAGDLRDQPTALLAAERENLRTAARRTEDPAALVALALGLARIDRYADPAVALAALDDALARAGTDPAHRAPLLTARADLRFLDAPQLGISDAREAVAIAPAGPLRAEALRILAQCSGVTGDRDLEARAIDESLEAWRACGDERGEAVALRTMGARHSRTGDFTQAYWCYRESAAALARLGAPWEEGRSLVRVTGGAMLCQDLVAAEAAGRRALQLLHPRLDALLYTEVLGRIATIAWYEERYDEADALLAEAASLARAARDAPNPRIAMQRAAVAVERGDLAAARALLGGLSVDGPFLQAELLGAWTAVRIAEGALDEAERLERDRWRRYSELGYGAGVGQCATLAALLMARGGRVADARAARDEALAALRPFQGPLIDQYRHLADGSVHAACRASGDRGAMRELDQAIRAVRALCPTGAAGGVAMAPDVRRALRLLERG